MSHGEQQDWSGVTTAVAVPPPKSGPSTVAALRTALSAESGNAAGAPWELLYRTASPAQQADLLALASQQGVLYSHQFPEAPSPRPHGTADDTRQPGMAARILGGQYGGLEPVRPQAVTPVDEALDEMQRYAVGLALATPDLCLVQGLPGTGKSRVAAEIVTQAALHGDRVLFVAAQSRALDRVLELVAQRPSLCPLRCVAPEEHLEQLPPAIRALTFQERTAAVRQQALRTARATKESAELQCARRRHQEPLWPRLTELADVMAGVQTALGQAEGRCAAVEAEVATEAQGEACKLASDVKSLQRTGEEKLCELATAAGVLESEQTRHREQLADVERQIAAVEPMAAAKQSGRWWTLKWWQATLRGTSAATLAGLQQQRQSAQSALDQTSRRLQELSEARHAAQQNTAANIQKRLATEVGSRQFKLRSVIGQHQAELVRHQSLWSDLCNQIEPATLRPAAVTADAVSASQQAWQLQKQDDEARCHFAREWAVLLETSSDSVAARLPGLANLVAAMPSGLAADPHFHDQAAAGGQFDLLVVDEADQLADGEILKLARRAQRCVLIGEPAQAGGHTLTGSGRPAAARPGTSSRGQSFHQLWTHLHCHPGNLPYAWFREGKRLACRLRHLAPEQRQWLESEPLADAPDVELRILALPRTRPELAEVLFSESMQLPTAKGFLFRELQEITVQTASHGLRWSETPQALELHFTRTPEGAGAVTLDSGVREYLMGPNLDQTSKLEFDRAAGWDRPAVEAWIDQHMHLRDLGRTVWLEEQHRMVRGLADVAFDILGTENCSNYAVWQESAAPVVDFIAALGQAKNKGNGRSNRKAEGNAGHFSHGGAGLETDLSSVRPGDRLPAELRSLVPGRGFVNLTEARCLVRKLEELLRSAPPSGALGSSFAVIALYPAQAELIRQLLQQSPLPAARAAFTAVGTPAAFRHREADVVLLSLTRSHGHRAVAYGDGPATLALALTRARQRLLLFGDPGNLLRRTQWRGAVDHLDEATAAREMHMLGQLGRYLQGQGRHQRAFRVGEGSST
jgi:hypothetical protein